MRELDPRFCEGIGELVRMIEEALRDGPVDRIHSQSEVGSEHEWRVPLRWIMRVRNRACSGSVFRSPLMCTRRALGEFPFEAEEVLQIVVAPLRRCLGPCAFQATGNRVRAPAAAKFIVPAETLFLDIGSFRFGSDILRRWRSAVSLAESVATCDQGNGFLV